MMEEADVLDFIDPNEDPTETPEDRADRVYEEAQKNLHAEFAKDAFVDPLAEFKQDAR